MAEISKITDITGNTYDLKDATARARNLPAGGTTGQVPKKRSNTDYDVEWGDAGGTTPGTVALGQISFSASWSGSGPYTQTVTVSQTTVGATSKVDLQPDATTLQQLIDDDVVSMYIENNNGTLTAYAVGNAPSAAMTMQCSVTEVV